jgi:sterol desaturase/sphingolipid hydroxylase (fatty acid hydroxylase superfamily)
MRLVAYVLWPVLVVVFGSLAYRVLEAGGGGLGLGLTTGATVVVLLLLERLLPLRRDRGTGGDPQLLNDIGHGALGNELGNRIGEHVFVAAAAALPAALSRRHAGPLWPADWPFAPQVVLLVVLADGLEYWRHRLLHRVPWLWPIHALHHSVDRLHALKGGRNNFLDMALRGAMVFAPLVAVGVPREVLLWYPATIIVLGPIAHANLALRFPSFVHRVLVTPPEHRLHHALDLRTANSNYAVVLPLWDIVFGTFTHPDTCPVPEVGIEEDPMPQTFLAQFVAPLLWPRLVHAARSYPPRVVQVGSAV